MNHVKTHQTNPMAPWHPLDALLTPWDPLGPPGNPPIDPLRPINRSLGLIALLRSPQLQRNPPLFNDDLENPISCK